MIRIKNYIFNEKEIVSIEPISNGLRVDLKSKSNYIDIYATVEDIEWNCDSQERQYNEETEQLISSLQNKNYKLQDRIKELEEHNKELVETNYDLAEKLKSQKEGNKILKFAMQDTYDSANDTCGELQQRIDKAIEYINDDLKDYQTISSGSANDLLKILRGEENEL